ncbi:MAG: alpha-ketoacid dehydrogenase subunit beta [Anaerolineaceae bacterium]|nr:alpha-ketoacid dehydrogenase subunit beta [Anaerolineaceae bacterium]MDE0329559.1 alpha-ketoacid dehydrogenase subunit beta [Anaerolineaceae bacterium]
MPRKTSVDAMREALRAELQRDERVVVIGEDVKVGVFGGTRWLHREFGDERVINTPISELAVAGAGVGAAATGIRPVIDLMFGTFLYLAFDQIANQAGAMRYMFGGQTKLPLVLMTVSGSGISAGHHHSQPVHPMFMNMPLIKVVLPSTPYDVKGLLISAIRDDNPVLFLSPITLGSQRGEVPDEAYTIPLAEAAIRREGGDVTICTAGAMTLRCLEVARTMAREGIECEVIDLRTLKPWDEACVLRSVRKTGRFVAVDESFPVCGAASEWAATVAEKAFPHLRAPVQRVSNLDVPLPYSPVLEKAAVPTTERILDALRRCMQAESA